MIAHVPFHYHKIEDLIEDIGRVGVDLPVTTRWDALAQPLGAGPCRLPNRIAVLPMEGCDGLANGAPDELTFRRYRRFAAGGAGLLWVEATAVVEPGRANPRQIWLHRETVPAFAELVRQSHEVARERHGASHRPILVVQLTHSGRYSRPGRAPAPIIAHRSKFLDPLHRLGPDYPVITDAELERLEDAYVEAARCAADAGFDAVDVKACHRYLISELHASFTRENSRYGGEAFENRSRFFRNIVGKIRSEVPSIAVTSRMNAYDAMAWPYGFGMDRQDPDKADLTEPIELVKFLRDSGAPFVNITIGNPYFNPYVNRPFDLPTCGAPIPPEHPLDGVARFVHVVRRIQQAVPDLPLVGGGYSWLRQFFPNVTAALVEKGWVSIVGGGRLAFAYPDFAGDIASGRGLDPEKVCVACSACTQIMRDGGRSGCVPKDSEVYEPIYKAGRAEAIDTITAMAKTCRQCAEPLCVGKCPAQVNVPKFVGEIAEGRYREAYETLRASNVLAAVCGYVCPAETLCESGCINEHYTEPVPIRHLQRWVSRKAVEEGWVREPRVPLRADGKLVAIVGAGPAGVAGAVTLASMGHKVTLFERDKAAGGVAGATIPPDRLPDPIIQREIEDALVSAGAIERRTVQLGKDSGLDQIVKDGYDAVLLAPGLGASVPLPSPTRPRTGVRSALEFLRAVKAGERVSGAVMVIGAGNTAIDAAVSAKRAGASDVSIVYRRSFDEMPAWPNERDEALKAGVHFLVLTQPVAYESDEGGRLTGLRVVRTKLGQPDASGRRKPIEMPTTAHVLPVDLVIEAIGQRAGDELREALAGVEFTRNGLIRTSGGSLATSREGVFAAGDIVNGGTTVVQAVAEGIRAAREIDRFLETEAGAAR